MLPVGEPSDRPITAQLSVLRPGPQQSRALPAMQGCWHHLRRRPARLEPLEAGKGGAVHLFNLPPHGGQWVSGGEMEANSGWLARMCTAPQQQGQVAAECGLTSGKRNVSYARSAASVGP